MPPRDHKGASRSNFYGRAVHALPSPALSYIAIILESELSGGMGVCRQATGSRRSSFILKRLRTPPSTSSLLCLPPPYPLVTWCLSNSRRVTCPAPHQLWCGCWRLSLLCSPSLQGCV